jgi:glycosyltransferase involved in cell wall biosynthesis
LIADLTIAIPVKNEEQNLAACLGSIGNDFAKDIVVIDSGSTDKTKSIASNFGVNVIDFKWNGKFPKKRNWYLRNHTPGTKWVLFLDADEHLTTSFKDTLPTALADETKVGYWLSYTRYFKGKELKGGYPLYKLALFKLGAGEYEHIEEYEWSKLDMEVHEHPVLTGEVGYIKAKIDHKDSRDGLEHYIQKHKEYAAWEARRVVNMEGAVNGSWRQKAKYALIKSGLIAPAYFIGSYLLMGGFRDGKEGLEFAKLKMDYFRQVRRNMRELRKGGGG